MSGIMCVEDTRHLLLWNFSDVGKTSNWGLWDWGSIWASEVQSKASQWGSTEIWGQAFSVEGATGNLQPTHAKEMKTVSRFCLEFLGSQNSPVRDAVLVISVLTRLGLLRQSESRAVRRGWPPWRAEQVIYLSSVNYPYKLAVLFLHRIKRTIVENAIL